LSARTSAVRFLSLDDGVSHPLYRVMRCLLGYAFKRARLEVRLENRLQYELERSLTTRSRKAGIERTRTLPPSFGISCLGAGSGL
jgi:hypothetical protein